jgi:hypothetical protein
MFADVAGQFSLYGAGPADAVLRGALYDQFFKKDYDPIMQVTTIVGMNYDYALIAASAVFHGGCELGVAECQLDDSIVVNGLALVSVLWCMMSRGSSACTARGRQMRCCVLRRTTSSSRKTTTPSCR